MKSLLWSLAYARSTMRHKWFVLRAGIWLGVPLRLLIMHDLSKFSLAELPHYGRQFFGDKGDPLGFSYAWLHHQRMNKHHWEAWIPITGHDRGNSSDGVPLPMPECYLREMVADWFGASRAYEGVWPQRGRWPWYERSFHSIKLHPDSRALAQRLVEDGLSKSKQP